MNITIPHSWLKEFLDTKASPQKIAEVLSLCSCSVEKIEKKDTDWIYEIEITTNRVDMMSVSGIAREAAVVLPRFGIQAKFKNDPYKKISNFKFQISNSNKNLKVIIKDSSLCPRFAAVILENVSIKPSAKIIQSRLKACGIRSINNIIDLSNYLMRAFGQPVHVFDYDKITDHSMILRASRKGEKITTLDGKTFTLPEDDIVIEDGSGRLIDLCGIMGGANSAVSDSTSNVLLFVQTYEPSHIRRTSMKLAQRSEAAQLFEKGIDPELVMPVLLEGIKLAKKWAGVKEKGAIIDIYPKRYLAKTVEINLDFINQRLGITLKPQEVSVILKNLGFDCKFHPPAGGSKFQIMVPSWRSGDIGIAADILEEVARIYGYHNLPSNLPEGALPSQPTDTKRFYWENRVKHCLKGAGLTEVYTYSMVARTYLEKFQIKESQVLKIKNPLTSDWEYMRSDIIESLLDVLTKNNAVSKNIRVFEIANNYLPRKNDLPLEKQSLVTALTGDQFYQTKGIIELLLNELAIPYEFKLYQSIWENDWMAGEKSLDIFSGKVRLGILGQLKPALTAQFNIGEEVYICDIAMEKLVTLAANKKVILPVPKFPPVIEDFSFTFPRQTYYSQVVDIIKGSSSLVRQIELLGEFKDNKTFRVYFQHPDKSLTSEEVSGIRKRIIQALESKGIRLRT